MNSICKKCGTKCMYKPVCSTCHMKMTKGIFKLNITNKTIEMNEEDFTSLNNYNHSLDLGEVYFFIGQVDGCTVIMIPNNGTGCDDIKDECTADSRSLSEEIE